MGAKLAGGGAGRYDVGQNNEINVTPFVDVMLVLLIIFMVAAPLAAVTIKVKLPPAAAKPAQTPPTPVYISIKQDGRIYVGDFATDIDSLGEDLTRLVGSRKATTRLFIRGDENMMYQDFMAVMNKLQDNAFYSVALVGEDRRGLENKK